MENFSIYFQLGLTHITDVQGYDHILFIVSLCAAFSYKELKKVAWLVTAFTVGHSVTLLLSALKFIVVNAYLVELLIPISILFTCCFNLYRLYNKNITSVKYHYALAASFGLIHGMGFSNFFNVIMGENVSIIFPLASFNIGLEFGQLVIVLILFGLNFVIIWISKLKPIYWNFMFSTSCGAVSLMLILERI